MNERIHYINCPLCGSAEIKNVLLAKDHTVSGETFVIAECSSCTLRFTQDVPDANSISPYYKSEDYISHSNTSKGFVNSLYKIIRKKTLIKKRILIKRLTGIKKGNLLDVGSGTGAFVNEMKKKEWNVTGLEPDNGARSVAQKLYNLELKDVEEFYHLQASSFDTITLWHVLEHVHDLISYVQQLKVLLKENGKLFIAVPNYTSLDAGIYKEYWAAYDVPRHLYHFSPQSVLTLMKKNNLKIIQYKPMWYDSFYISLLSSKYEYGRSKWFSALWNGFRSNLKAMGDVKKCSSVIYVISK